MKLKSRFTAASGRSSNIFEPLEPRRLLSTTVAFENLAVGPVGNPTTGIYDDASGFRFTLRTSGGGTPGKPSQIYGAPQGFPSKVLHAAEWGQQYLITRADGQGFDLTSLDRAASRYGDAGDFVITGTFEGGGTQQQTVAFSASKTPQTLALDWTNLTQVRIAFAGGVNSAYGALDNFVFDDAGGDAPPTTTGTLADPDPAAGPLKVKFDGQTWHEARQIAPRANGSFYLVGR